jgi:hypothetical protein
MEYCIKPMKKIPILLFCLLIVSAVFGQKVEDVDELDYNPRKERPFGGRMVVGGFNFIPALGLEYYIIPDLKIGFDYGFLSDLYMTGLQYHLNGNKNKLGTFTLAANYLVFEDPDRGNTNEGWYFPVGFQYMGMNGWYVSGELGPLTHKDIQAEPWFFGIGVGYHFNGLKWRK